MKRALFAILLLLAGAVLGSPARAASVWGFGSITTNHPDPALVQIDTEYEHPDLLDARKIVQLSPAQVGGAGSKTFDHIAQAQFGRLRARSFVAGQVPLMPELSSGVDLSVEFLDQIDPQNLPAPPATVYLRLDIELRGEMTRRDDTFGNSANARFGVTLLDLESETFRNLSFVEFAWFGDVFSTTNESNGGLDTPRFVPYPGEEPRFELLPIVVEGDANYSFATRGHLDVPLDEDEGFEDMVLGEPFLLSVTASAGSGCGTEPCLSITDFAEATVGNARFVDENGDVVAGASLTSASGHDYDAVPVPEAVSSALGATALGTLGLGARRSRRPRHTNLYAPLP
jgi:hypothetical protein